MANLEGEERPWFSNKQRPNPGAIVDDALLLSSNYRGRSTLDPSRWSEKTTAAERWSPPARGMWKFNVDGSWLEGKAEGSAAGVCRGHRGALTAGFAKRATAGAASPLEIEALAVKEALLCLAAGGV